MRPEHATGMHADDRAPTPIHWRDETRPGPPDLESAVLLRMYLLPVFTSATSWADLVERLDDRGFGLSIRDGHLTLTDRDSGAHICTSRFLGAPLAQLSARLGRPCVRARPGQGASGELLV